MSDVAVVVPVLRRPHRAAPFMESLRASTDRATVYAIVGGDGALDLDTTAAWTAAGANVLACWGSTFPEKVNHAYRMTGEPWLFLTGDDVAFHPGWVDELLRAAAETGAQVIGSNDLANPRAEDGSHAPHLLISREYIAEQGASWDGPGVVCHEGYRHMFCNPPEAPIWMADLSFKSLGEVRVGDEVVGFERYTPEGSKFSLNRLRRSTVEAVRGRESEIVRVTMESGRSFRCTPDHRWYNANWTPSASRRWKDYPQWVTPTVGRQLLHVADDPGDVPVGLERTAGWVGGIYDGEGSWIQIAQYPDANPEVHAAIGQALNKLDIPHTASGSRRTGYFYTLTGGRQAYLKFLLWCQPVKRRAIAEKILNGRRFGHSDRIVSVEPDGHGEVLSMTTSTGNYVAWGYASRNCDDEIVTVAKQRGVFAFAREAVVEHLHPVVNKAEVDATYRLVHPVVNKAEVDATYRLGWSYAEVDKSRFAERMREYAQ